MCRNITANVLHLTAVNYFKIKIKMNKYIGIGQENVINNKWTISIFLGKRYVAITFYTKKYKLIPRFYLYGKESFKYKQELNMFNISWFFGFVFYH